MASAYKNINTDGLIQAIDAALRELNSNKLDGVKTSLETTNVMNSSPRSVATGSIDKIMNSTDKTGSIATLRNNLNTLRKAVVLIQTYQGYEREYDALVARSQRGENVRSLIDAKRGQMTSVNNQIYQII